jgi:hypothetical protein
MPSGISFRNIELLILTQTGPSSWMELVMPSADSHCS